MNKKRLSVVMAGAMLATSVAPVLAAETTGTEIAYNQRKAFVKQILADMANKDNKISNYAIFKEAGFLVDADIANNELKLNDADGEFSSKLGVKIIGKNGVVKLDTTYTTESAKGLETALNNLVAGDKVEVYERETTTFAGQLIPGSGLKAKTNPEAYNKTSNPFSSGTNLDAVKAELAVTVNSVASKFVKSASVTAAGSPLVLSVATEKFETPTGTSKVTLKFKETDNRIDGRLAYDEKDNLLDVTNMEDVEKFDHFGDKVTWTPASEAADKGAKLVSTYTIGEKEADASKETLKVADLFDGLALTARGTEIVADLANAEKAFNEEGDVNTEAPLVKLSTDTTPGADNTNLDANGLATFTISYYKNATDSKKNQNPEKVITVASTDKKELVGLFNLLKSNKFQVGVVAGQNRYETAVNVAKQQTLTVGATGHIVLVNGESLVDGLSAAPLASVNSAPLLLSQSDKLPTATKEYMEELTKSLTAEQKKTVTIDLVGGSSVLETSLVKELKEMGFKTIVRHGGENREETSVEVARAINSGKTIKKAFVVGANGEADAMSIAAVAAKTSDVTPIIVAKAGGISDTGLDYLEDTAANDVTIVGGTSVVSEKEEAKINKSLVGAKAMRLAGKNRIETNNAIIKEYYKGTAEGVVVVKDGIANKSELIDALSAANYAATNKAPIVLATSGITDAQKSTLLKAKKSSGFKLLAQVGIGAERTVLETLADLLDINNKYVNN